VDRRLGGGAGEVAGDPQDQPGEHHADRHRARRDDPRVAAVVGQRRGRVEAGQAGEGGRQVHEGRRPRRERPGHRRDAEAPVDRGQAALRAAHPGHQHAERGDQRPDRGHDQREHQPLLAERRFAEDQRGHQRHRVGLEEVRGHARAVADVVAHVVRDRRRVARVVLGDPLLDLADQVRADVRRLGEDAAADPHEHREQGRAEAEALQHRRGVTPVEQHHDGGAEQAEAHHRHADHPTGAQGDPRTLRPPAGQGRRGGDTHVRPGRQPHAEVADRRGETRPDQEEQRPADLDPGVAGQQEQQRQHDHGEQRQRAELPGQVRGRALLDGGGDPAHRLRALVGREHLAPQHHGHDQGGDPDSGDDGDDDDARRTECDHASSSDTGAAHARPPPDPPTRPRCRAETPL
jgi:hypothetical protein